MPAQPIVELACATWIGAERLICRYILRGRMMLPPTADAVVGPTVVSVTMPTGDILTFDARIVRIHYGRGGVGIGMELRFPELSTMETRNLSQYASRLERGASLPPTSHYPGDRVPESGFHQIPTAPRRSATGSGE